MPTFEAHAATFATHLRSSVEGAAADQVETVIAALNLEVRPDESTDWELEIEGLRDTSGSGAHVLRIRNTDDLAVWTKLVSEQLPMDPAAASVLAQAVEQAGFGSTAPIQAFYARLDGVPMGTSLAVSLDGVGGVHAVTTSLQARRRGIGRALTEKAIRGGETVGAEHAVLRAAAKSSKNCERMGFNRTR